MDDHLKPFGSIESSHEYVNLLVQAIDEAVVEIEEHICASTSDGGGRRLEALQLVAYTLKRLRQHMTTSRRLLSNLKTLRTLILRGQAPPPPVALDPIQEATRNESEIHR